MGAHFQPSGEKVLPTIYVLHLGFFVLFEPSKMMEKSKFLKNYENEVQEAKMMLFLQCDPDLPDCLLFHHLWS